MGKRVKRKWRKARVVGFSLILILLLAGAFFFGLKKLLNTHFIGHQVVSIISGKSGSRAEDRSARDRKRSEKKPSSSSKTLAYGANQSSGPLSVPKSIHVLMYHSINDKTSFVNSIERSLTIPTKVFADQVDWLKAHGYHVISLSDAYAGMVLGKPLPSNPVVLSFDDGIPDAYTNVYPILKQRGLSGTFFVITARVSNGPWLTWPQIIEMAKAGMQIESHTMDHVDLTTTSPEETAYELKQSKLKIEAELHRPVDFIAYPAGRANQAVAEATKQAGYLAAFTTRPGPWRPGDDPFTLKRVRVSRGETMATFAAELGYTPTATTSTH